MTHPDTNESLTKSWTRKHPEQPNEHQWYAVVNRLMPDR
jgi:hypothetical protein